MKHLLLAALLALSAVVTPAHAQYGTTCVSIADANFTHADVTLSATLAQLFIDELAHRALLQPIQVSGAWAFFRADAVVLMWQRGGFVCTVAGPPMPRSLFNEILKAVRGSDA